MMRHLNNYQPRLILAIVGQIKQKRKMDKSEFMGKLLNAVDTTLQEHKNAQTQSKYIYTLGKLEALKQVAE